MTVQALHRLLGKLIDDGHARREVLVYRDTFQHNCEPEVGYFALSGANPEGIYNIDGDGAIKVLANGTESCRTCCVLFGESGSIVGGRIKCDP